MILKLVPDYYFTTIEDIPYDKLYADGVRLILTDLDNTLISYKEEEPTLELFKWKEKILNMGFEVIIVSNSRKHRVEHFANKLGLPFVKFAKKPTKFGMKIVEMPVKIINHRESKVNAIRDTFKMLGDLRKMKKRIKLRGWVLVVLKSLLLIDMFIMICNADTLTVMFLKTIITIIVMLPILYLLIRYGD